MVVGWEYNGLNKNRAGQLLLLPTPTSRGAVQMSSPSPQRHFSSRWEEMTGIFRGLKPTPTEKLSYIGQKKVDRTVWQPKLSLLVAKPHKFLSPCHDK